ncbi:hypothetical protein ACFL31_03980 [Candidatus Margulisiibacteriota bacterium]
MRARLATGRPARRVKPLSMQALQTMAEGLVKGAKGKILTNAYLDQIDSRLLPIVRRIEAEFKNKATKRD